ncbi:RagB/SusD family nutrient uptake outer membrane protein [Flavobacterium rhizosphaerae]|uniref:RagB/SusD family nutrient uptake outer membrane protein n=1 Tax=Flavobacterium rhizosphaerae TaxID=3163298 RepID=A0ABW8Z274_9FLAO
MKNSIKLLMISLLLVITSCEEMVEVDMPNNQLGTEQVFADAQTAYAALSGPYSDLRTQSLLSGNNFGTGALLGSYADELDCYFNDLNGYEAIASNTQLPTNSVIQTIWNNTYRQIYAANAIIAGAENAVALSQPDRDQVIGEALTIRSLLYFNLQQLFGDIPYTRSTDYEYNRSLGKTVSAAVLSNLEADLNQAIGLLSDAYRDPERIYPNRQVAAVVLLKVYLSQQRYSEAEQVALQILQSPNYQFQPDISQVFNAAGSHILWQIKPQYSGDSTQEASFYYFDNAPPSAYALSEGLIAAFEPGDLRRDLWVAEVTVGGQQYYRPFKYKSLSGSNTTEYSVVFRLEEVYLLLAETLAMQNRISDALPYLNATRLRAGLPALEPTSQTALLDVILQEKRCEFFTEQGIRFTDLKRNGRLSQLSVVKPNWEPYNRVWPYPQNELLLNPNLAPQNENY